MFFDRLPGAGYVCAHRGARSLAPENTLLAARAALEAGADFWELDVQRSADGALVVFHDDFLERTTDVSSRADLADRAPWAVRDFTLAELRGLDAGSWFGAADPHGGIAAGEVSPEAVARMAGARIPTFRETLDFCREHGLPVNVEIKDQIADQAANQVGDRNTDPGIAEQVLRELRESGTRDLVLVSSFNHDYLRTLHRLDPELPLAALVEERHPDDLPDYLRGLGVLGYHPDVEITDPELVRGLAARGFRVSPWTVNDADAALALLDAGGFAAITDYPQRLRRVLEARRDDGA